MTKTEQVTQDELYKYLLAHDIKLSRLAEMIGLKTPEPLMSCFKHHKDWHGRPRKFNAGHIARLNEALPLLAENLLDCRLKFGSKRVFVSKNGKVYDLDLVEPVKRIGNYLNITAMLVRVCGWSKGKKNNVLSKPNDKMYGWISKDDAVAINQELLSIAGVLSRYELVGHTDTLE